MPAKKEYRDQQDAGVSIPGLPVPAKYSRNYVSVPQPGLDGRTSPVYTAAVVGGGTVVNGMFFNRGSAGDYDAWEQLGNPGWNWNGPKGLLHYFKKVRTMTLFAARRLMLPRWLIDGDIHSATRRSGCRVSHLQRFGSPWDEWAGGVQFLELPISNHE